jgi:NAD(P)-dependent dehydrogenase (short-subunit alcohol dehydrogenase family)
MQQTILVTGGASGIGLAIAEAFLTVGWRAVIADVMETNLDDARKRLEKFSERTRFERDQSMRERFGVLDGLVNSAGIGRDVPALETTVELFRKILDVNLIGSFITAREATRRMHSRAPSSILLLAR